MILGLFTGEKHDFEWGVTYNYLSLTDGYPSQPYVITHIDGLDAPQAIVQETSRSNGGVLVTGTKIDMRTVVLTFAINPPYAENRDRLYKYFNVESDTLSLYYSPSHDGRDLVLPVKVQKITCDAWDNPQMAQVTLLAGNPLFKKRLEESRTPIRAVSNSSEVFTVDVGGDAPCGLILKANISSAVGSLTIGIGTPTPEPGKAYILTNRMYFYNNSQAGIIGTLDIDTREGHKSVKLGGVSRFDLVMLDSVWFKLTPGQYQIKVEDSSNVEGNTVLQGRCETLYYGG